MSDESDKRPKRANTDSVPEAKDHVAVRLEPEVVAEVDAVALELATPWCRASHSDALRMLLLKGLDAYKAERAPKGDPDPTT